MRLWKYISILLLFYHNSSYSQYCGTVTTNVSITPTSTAQLTTSYSSGRRAFNFVATAGCVYEFSTCSQTTGDSYLRLYSTGTGGTLLAQNDNTCGTQSTLTWTATVNGTVSVLLTRASCNALQVATRISYKLVSCSPPPCAILTAPVNELIDAPVSQTLSWGTVSTATSYDVYFGTNTSPPLIGNQTSNTYNPGTLNYSTTYYWKIVSKNSNGSASNCSTWSFTTAAPGCLTATYGQFPTATFVPSCTGSNEIISSSCYASEYSLVTLTASTTYTLSSSIATDFITVSNSNGTTVLGYGTTPITFTPTSDGNYRFYVHTNNSCGASSSFRARRISCPVTPPPENDLCSQAIDVGLCGGTFTGSTRYATQTGDAPSCYTGASETWTAPGVWYKVVGNGQNITASLCGSSFDTKIFIYTGTCGSLTCLTYNDDFCSLQSQATFSSTANEIYHILVTGYGSAKGNFTLSVTLDTSPPVITQQPNSINLCSDDSTTLSVTAMGSQSPFTYQWYKNNISILNANSSTLNVNSAGSYFVTITNACNVSVNSDTVIVNKPGRAASAIVTTSAVCYGGIGSATISVTGGYTPYSYLWSNGFTSNTINAPAGSYTVTVTDANGCQIVNSTTITQPSQVSITTTVTNVTCYGLNNGSISASASGGTPPYIYLWNNNTYSANISNLTAGTYVLSVTDNKGCTRQLFNNISQPDQLSISLDIISYPNCGLSNGQVSSSIIGGEPPYTYLWSNGQVGTNLTNVAAGDYTLTVTDSKGCQQTSTMTLGCSFSLINVEQISGIASVCGINTTTYTINYSNSVPESITWVLPNGVTSTNGLNNSTVNVSISNNFIQDSIKVDVVSNSITYRRNLWITKIPSKPILSGTFCGDPVGSIKTYIITNSQTNTTYNWVPPYGVNVFTGQGNDTTQLKFSSFLITGSSGLVTATNSCGNSTSQYTVDKLVARPTSIIGPSTICADGNTIYTYRVDSVPTSFMYIWNVPNGVSVIGSSSNDTLKVKFSTNFTSGQFSVMSVNKCGSSPMTYGTVSNNNLYANIGTITGPGDLCPYLGQSVTYSVTNQNGTFTWNIPANVTIQSGQGTNVITVLVSNSFTSGTISVNLNNGCGGSISTSKSLSTTTSTISASSITGPRSVCSLIGTNISTTFSVSPINGVNYNWSVPANATIVSGQGTNAINVTFQSGYTGGNISVTITGGCGNPVVRTRLVGLGLPTVSINGVSCVDNGYTNTYSVLVTDAISFNWILPGNAQILRGQGTNSVDIYFPGNFESSSCVNNSCDSIRVTIQYACGSVVSKRKIGLLTQRPTVTGTSNVCYPDTIRLTASISPRITSYIWNNPNGTQFIGSTIGNVIYAKSTSTFLGGTFSVMGVNTCGSSPMSYFGVNKVCDNAKVLGFEEEIERNFDFIVFPNPGNGLVQLRVFHTTHEKFKIVVTDVLGKVYLNGIASAEDEFDLRFLKTGFYQIIVYDESGNYLTKLFSKFD